MHWGCILGQVVKEVAVLSNPGRTSKQHHSTVSGSTPASGFLAWLPAMMHCSLSAK